MTLVKEIVIATHNPDKKKEIMIALRELGVNILSLDRSVNIWAEAAKKDEDLDPIKGSKTLTKKSQDKITINPMEKQPSRAL